MNTEKRHEEYKYLYIERLANFPQDVRGPISDTFYYGAYSGRCTVLAYKPEDASTRLGVLNIVHPSSKKRDYREWRLRRCRSRSVDKKLVLDKSLQN